MERPKLQPFHEMLSVTAALSDAGIEYALCGGLAVALHGAPRMTVDIDLILDEANLPNALTALERLGYDEHAGRLKFDAGKSSEVRLYGVSKVDGAEIMTLDLLYVDDGLREVWNGREQWTVAGQPVTVLSRSGLIEMKRASGRPRDLADIAMIEALDE